LDAARELFAECADVPMYEVARRAKVGQATLYRNFPDRRNLAAALLAEHMEQTEQLAAAHGDITHRKAKDILRASQLALLDEKNKHVAADLNKVSSGQSLSPILLLRGDDNHPLIIADGYHRVCASYWLDENTDIPCILI